MYSALHLYPVIELNERQGLPLFMDLYKHLAAKKIDFMRLFVQEHDICDAESGDLIDEFDDLDYDAAIQILKQTRAGCVSITFNCLDWGRKFEKEIREQIPRVLHDDFIPWDVHLCLGPTRFHKLGEEDIDIHVPDCQINFSGDGMPTDVDAYLAQATQLPSLQAVRNLVEAFTQSKWQWALSGG